MEKMVQVQAEKEAYEILQFAKSNKIRFVDLRFTDMPGQWHHFSIPAHRFDEDSLREGEGFDGSSIRGFQAIQESDMLLVPDKNHFFIDPFMSHPTLSVTCDIRDPATGKRYERDPRFVAHKAEEYVKSTGIADTVYFGPELEFYIFDDIRFYQNQNSAFYQIESGEGFWNSGRDEKPNLGHKPRFKEGYFPVPPMDSLQDLRSEMVETLNAAGVPVEVHHHEVGGAGQAEIDMRFDSLRNMADKVQTYKYIVKNVARKNGKTVTFMPKPIFEDNGSGMHCHQSLWKDGKNVFFDEKGYAGMSQEAIYYIGGLLSHAHSLLALTNPTTNSYRRLVPGYEAPVNLVYSKRNRSAAVRIPTYFAHENAKRIEFRCPDCTANPYYAFAAMTMAGLDGIKHKTMPPHAVEKNLYKLGKEELDKIRSTPSSLEEALDALEADHNYLLQGDVFTPGFIESWIEYKRNVECAAVKLRPHPWEFALYYDI